MIHRVGTIEGREERRRFKFNHPVRRFGKVHRRKLDLPSTPHPLRVSHFGGGCFEAEFIAYSGETDEDSGERTE